MSVAAMAQSRPSCRSTGLTSDRGIDVLVRPETKIPVEPFDGRRLPCGDKSFDVVSFIHVLHHTDDPTILLKEAKRVARKIIALKDHTMDGVLAYQTLRFMDWVGNASHGVALPYNYWPEHKWRATFAAIGLRIADWQARLDLYPFPASLVFERASTSWPPSSPNDMADARPRSRSRTYSSVRPLGQLPSRLLGMIVQHHEIRSTSISISTLSSAQGRHRATGWPDFVGFKRLTSDRALAFCCLIIATYRPNLPA